MRISYKTISKILIGFILITAPFYRLSIFHTQILDVDVLFSAILLVLIVFRGNLSIYRTSLSIALYFYTIYALCSSIWSPSTPYSGWFYTVKIIVVAIVLLVIIPEIDSNYYRKCFFLSGIIVLILLATRGDNYYGGLRYTIIVGESYIDPNVLFPLYILPVVMILDYLLSISKKKIWVSVMLISYFVISVVYVFLSGSRSTLLAIAISMLLYTMFHFKSPKVLVIGLILIVAAYFFIINYVPQNLLTRFAYSSLEESGGGGRIEIWKNAIDQIKTSSTIRLLFGNGINSSKIVLGKTAHNILLEAIVEYGLVGFIVLGNILVKLFSTFLANKDFFNLSVLVGFLTIAMTVSMNNMLIFWMYILYFYVSVITSHVLPRRC